MRILRIGLPIYEWKAQMNLSLLTRFSTRSLLLTLGFILVGSVQAQDSTHWQRDMVLGNDSGSSSRGSSSSESSGGMNSIERDADRLDDEGRAYMEKGDYTEALQYFKEAYDKSQLERYAKTYRNDIAWAQRAIDRAALGEQAMNSWGQHDYQAALEDYLRMQQIFDGPNVRECIANSNAMVAWSEAKTAADYRRALKLMRPGFYSQFATQERLRSIQELDAKEKFEKERAKREAAAAKAAVKARNEYSKLVASVDTAPRKPSLFVTQDAILKDVFGDRIVQAHPEFSYANSPEALSERARHGFDTPGSFLKSGIITNAATPTAAPSDIVPGVLEKYRKYPEIVELQKQWKEQKIAQGTADKEFAEIQKLKKSPYANQEQLATKEAQLRTRYAAAQSKLNAIATGVKTFNESHVN